MKRNIRIAVVFTLLLISISVSGFTLQRRRLAEDGRLPTGDWTLSSHAYQGRDLSSMPAVVVAVTTDATRGLEISKVGLRNRLNSKAIIAVKLLWSLSVDENGYRKVLQSAETPLIWLPETLEPGGRQDIVFPVVSFAKVFKNLNRNNNGREAYRFDVASSPV